MKYFTSYNIIYTFCILYFYTIHGLKNQHQEREHCNNYYIRMRALDPVYVWPRV